MGYTPVLDVLDGRTGIQHAIPTSGLKKVSEVLSAIPGDSRAGAALISQSGKTFAGCDAIASMQPRDREAPMRLSRPLSAG